MSSADIADWISKFQKPTLSLNLTDILCHSQSVESSVKLITKASSKVYGHELCDGFIRVTLTSCATMLKFDASVIESTCGYR